MAQKAIDMINKIMAMERMGYAYVYPSDRGAAGEGRPIGERNPIEEKNTMGERNLREEYPDAATSENLADFISSHRDAHRITVTDIADRLILDASVGFVNGSPRPKHARKASLGWCKSRLGRADGEILQLDRKQADAYIAADGRVAAMSEYV